MTVENFDAKTVPLRGTNLVEASAGTGKTYSIAILVLRLILEQRVEVKEILMVTFTKAAVAELQERIWLFIREAHRAALGHTISDPIIADLVKSAAEKTSIEAVQSLLRNAVLFLDETSVLTIHSFCQQTLTEFAFETNQLFGAETLKDPDELVRNEVNKFWRSDVTTLQPGLLGQLLEHGMKRDDIVLVIKEHLSGKKYFEYDENESYSLCDEDQESLAKSIEELVTKETEMEECLHDHIRDNADQLKVVSQNNRYARESLLHFIDQPSKFVAEVKKKITTGYVIKLYGDVVQQISDCEALAIEKDKLVQSVKNRIYCHAIGIVTKAIVLHKQRYSLLSFDDIIVNLHKAVVHDSNQQLIACLQLKYKAIFADEFQDTDKLQYEIFHTVFGSCQNILFYIGDPKQSIYAWRKADIFTYFKAAAEVDHTYGMNINYRSSPRYIEAMNLFFKPEKNFDTFYFNHQDNAIEYIKVQSPAGSSKGELYVNGKPDSPLTIFESGKNDDIIAAVTAQVTNLLTSGKYEIKEKGTRRSVTPVDIGILVKTNSQASNMKSSLAKKGIPAVTIDDSKILQSEEALYVLYLLEALTDISRPTINKALLSPFTGYDTAAILLLNEETVLEAFREYKNIWDKDGVYSFLTRFVADYQVKALLLRNDVENGERALANLFQIIEVLHKVQSARLFNALELVNWLKRGIGGMQHEGDEFEQRVESDEEAVKIVTIHKSKGLEYNIVFAPFLDLRQYMEYPVFSFRDAQTGDYISIPKSHLDDKKKALVIEQSEQEYRRLIYVAITRAVYKCYLSRNLYYKESALIPFTAAARNVNPELICFEEAPTNSGRFYTTVDEAEPIKTAAAVNFHLLQANWRKLSYTSLAAPHAATPKNNSSDHPDDYDFFIFRQLTKGSKTGNLLHYIFENIDFSSQHGWPRVIQQALRRFMPAGVTDSAPLLQMMQHLTNVSITVGGTAFHLAEVAHQKRLNELEFDFNVPLFDPAELNTFEDNGSRINVRPGQQVEGIMNGKMDMFFEHGGRYYILDWKSNFLGDSLEYYRHDVLNEAMSENNYHLQYLLYTVAAKRFLATRLPGFDYSLHFGGVIYLFVRGVRSSGSTGIFTTKPALEKIERLEALLTCTEFIA